MANIWADSGNSADVVTTQANTTGVFDWVFEVDADAGTLIRIANTPSEIGLGTKVGVPHYMKLRSGASTDLPVDTQLEWRMKLAGEDQYVRVSERVDSIAQWTQDDLTTQRSTDNVDSTKIDFQAPPGSDRTGSVNAISVRDIDTLRLYINSSAAISHADTEFYVEPQATETRTRSERV